MFQYAVLRLITFKYIGVFFVTLIVDLLGFIVFYVLLCVGTVEYVL